MGSAIDGGNRKLVHPLLTDTSAALANDAALRVVVDEWRNLPFQIIFLIRERVAGAIFTESIGLILQLAFTCAIADRTIYRVIREQEFDHGLAHILDLF